MIRLYEAIHEKLGNKFNMLFQTMAEGVPLSGGIFLYPSSEDVEDLSGATVYESVKAHIQITAESGEDGFIEALNYLREFVDRIEAEQSSVEGVEFIMCRHLGPKALGIGRDSRGFHVCVSNIDIKYILID